MLITEDKVRWQSAFQSSLPTIIPKEVAQIDLKERPLWRRLALLGTESWLDTGDLEGAGAIWDHGFTALTTNNSLLNKEVQKGGYDDLIGRLAETCAALPAGERVLMMGLLINVHHALRLVFRFGCRVSVELHTDLADDTEATVATARVVHAIDPEHFIIKVPLTPAGLIAIRRLREHDIPVNCTLGFSARQNLIATEFARPSFVNVFLGRVNGLVADNGFGSGDNCGEKTTLASQRAVSEARRLADCDTRQIAASIRDEQQVANLAGVEVLTMPLKVAEAAIDKLATDELADHTQNDPEVQLDQPAGELGIEALWAVDESVKTLAGVLRNRPPTDAQDLVAKAREGGLGDCFPVWGRADRERIRDDGKIPVVEHWQQQLEDRMTGFDALLNISGLEAFAKDQAELDLRIRERLA